MKKIANSKKRVLLLGINFSPELTGIGKYTGEMASWLTDTGYSCTVVTSYPYYPYWKVQAPHNGMWYKKESQKNGDLTIYRCPLYVPDKPTGLKRVLHEFTYCISAFFIVFLLLFKPRHDQIFCMAPPFLLGYLALFYRFFKGGKMVYHIHDMQIEAARDLGILKTQSVFKILFKLEKYILEKTDFLCTVSLGMRKKIIKKTKNDVIYFPNWVNTDHFWPLSDALSKENWGFNERDKIVLYSGSLGEKQGLEAIIPIAKSLAGETDIKFVICGTGPYKDKLVTMATQNDLQNVFFLPLQDLQNFNRFLNMADIHLVIQKKNASDLMMPSKLINILAVGGLALVTADPGSNLYEEINDHQMGILVPAEDQDRLTQSILSCCRMDHSAVRRNGRRYAETFLDRQNILQELMMTLEKKTLNRDRLLMPEAIAS